MVACVSLNRPGPDTELLCGFYLADCRGDVGTFVYRGLGDDPSKYELHFTPAHLRVEDDQISARREARNHRLLIAEHWRRRMEEAGGHEQTPTRHHHDRRLVKILDDARSERHHQNHYTKPMLRSLLGVLMEVSPTPAALVLFAEGLGSMYHVHRLYRVADELDRHEDARIVLSEIYDKIDTLSHERARGIIDTLVVHYGG